MSGDLPAISRPALAYKTGWFDAQHGVVDEAAAARWPEYAAAVADVRDERREQENRCANEDELGDD